MKIHLVKAFLQRTSAFFTFGDRFVAHFLQKLKRFFALIALVLINRHWENALPKNKF